MTYQYLIYALFLIYLMPISRSHQSNQKECCEKPWQSYIWNTLYKCHGSLSENDNNMETLTIYKSKLLDCFEYSWRHCRKEKHHGWIKFLNRINIPCSYDSFHFDGMHIFFLKIDVPPIFQVNVTFELFKLDACTKSRMTVSNTSNC